MTWVRSLSLLLLAAALFALASASPLWNFDSVGYAGLARHWLGQSDRELLDGVYGDLERAAPPKAAQEISAGTEYRRAIASDPLTFARQLPFYQNKPLYVLLVAVTARLGGNSIRAAFLVSAACFAALGVVVALWCTALLGQKLGWLLALSLLLSPIVREIGQIATPDATATLLVVAGLYLLIQHRRWNWAMVLLTLSILCRPDQLFLVVGVIFWSRSSLRNRWAPLIVGVGMFAVASVAASLSGAYSWRLVFVHTFVHKLITSSDHASASLLPLDYLTSFGRGIIGDFVFHPSVAPLFAAGSIVCWASVANGRSVDRASILRFQAMLWLVMLAHFAIFPMLADRFFVAQYLGIAITSAWLLGSRSGGDLEKA
jgi:hypothetical protein